MPKYQHQRPGDQLRPAGSRRAPRAHSLPGRRSHACYAFQVAEYAKHFTCISLDLRGTGEPTSRQAPIPPEILADDVAAFMRVAGIGKAHIAGLSLGAAVAMWLAANNPDNVESLSLHGGWPKTDAFQRTIVEGWQVMAKGAGCSRHDHSRHLPGASHPSCMNRGRTISSRWRVSSGAVRRSLRWRISFSSRMPSSLTTWRRSWAGSLCLTLITFGRRDLVMLTRFADRLKSGIRNSEVLIFEGCAHAPLYENVEEFNGKTLQFLQRQARSVIA